MKLGNSLPSSSQPIKIKLRDLPIGLQKKSQAVREGLKLYFQKKERRIINE
jgi:hypothetical protein